MISKGPAKKVTIFVNEDTQHHHGSLYESILTFLMNKGVAGATATKALAGFGAHHLMHTPKIEVLAEHMPVRIEFVETAQKVDEVLPTLYDMVSDGLIEVQDTMVIKSVRKERKPTPAAPHQEKRQPAKLMRIFLGESDRWMDEPLYEAIVKRLRILEVAGATVYRGVDGYGFKGHSHKHGFLHVSRDRPIMISLIDTPGKIAEAVPVIEEMMQDGLIALSDVDMIRLVRSGPDTESGDANSQSG